MNKKAICLFIVSLLSLLPCAFAATTAPDFTLSDQSGKSVTLSSFKGKIVVLEWTNPDCPFVKRHYNSGTMKKLAAEYAKKDVVWLAINSSRSWTTDKAKSWSESAEIVYPVLNDSTGVVGKAYGAKTTPHMFVVNAKGEIAYQGAIDDDSFGESEKVTNYVAAALDELIAGKAVTTSETKPYGCSVKYAS